jgi:ribosomal protein L4
VADRRGGKALVVIGPDELDAGKSFRNLAGIDVLSADDTGVADIIRVATLVLTPAAVESLTARARKPSRVAVGEEA